MCGIAGVISTSPEPVSLRVLEAMAGRIAYRGPDASGFFRAPGVGLAHRRLSIIDLSDHARQPITNEDGSIQVIYNGEIYNYVELMEELRQSGHVFASRSDSEVIAHAYEQYGTECVAQFSGMFAFGLWDARQRQFFAARDRIGIKPFYYFFDGKTFVFASEIKALLLHPSVTLCPDGEAIRDYLLFDYTVSDQTWYQGIRELPAGCTLLVRDGQLTIQRYWDVPTEIDYARSADSFVEELRSVLEDSVRKHLRSDVPVGAYLSGGVDSSTVVALATRFVRPLHTFSVAFDGYPECDERSYIRQVVEACGTVHSELLPGAKDLPRTLNRIIWHLDQPVCGPAIVPMYLLAEKVARSGVRVVLTGHGGDEAFGGYPPFYVAAVRSMLHALRAGIRFPVSELLRAPQFLVAGGALSRLRTRLTAGGALTWLRDANGVRSEIVGKWEKMSHGAADPFARTSYILIKRYLGGLLQQEDRMSMAWSVESRVPLLDHRVVELASRMPAWYRIRNGRLKWPLREAVRGTVPEAILNRTDKKGYPTPISQWLAGPIASYIRAVFLRAEPLAADEFLESPVVRQMVEEHTAGTADHGALLWKLLNLELWMRGTAAGWRDVVPSDAAPVALRAEELGC